MKHITQQQADYIRAHVNDRPRVKVARDAGVSLDTVYRIVRETLRRVPPLQERGHQRQRLVREVRNAHALRKRMYYNQAKKGK